MANTLTGLSVVIYLALDMVARELIGFIPAAYRNVEAEIAALGQTITYPVVGPAVTHPIVPGPIPPNDGDETVGTGSMQITRSEYASLRWTGEEQRLLSKGITYQRVLVDQFAQRFRALSNYVESDLASLYSSASRAYGIAGTAPFGVANDLSDFSQVAKILDDNGAPPSDRHFVLGTSAKANLGGKQAVLFKVNEAGSSELLRNGIVGRVEGFDLHSSGKVPLAVTSGTGAAYQVNNAGPYPIGTIAIAVDTGTGTVLAGDSVTFGGDPNRYVSTGLSAGVLGLAAPGLQKTLADNVVATVGAAFTPNLAFERNAIHLIARLPAMPEGGDDADDVMEVTDEVSGLTFQVVVYRQYRQVRFEVGLAWGYKAVKPEFIVQLLG